jgi:hypothetical protein
MSVGILYKAKLITLEEEGIRLAEEPTVDEPTIN